jgi:hypothetical protein
LTTTSSSSLVFAGSTVITIPSSVNALNNLTVANSGGVTLGAGVTVSGQLQINSGTLNLGGFTSTAGSLSFNSGATPQASGTWGNAGSGAANTDATHFAGSGTVNVLYGSDSGTQFRSNASGNWNAAATWQVSSDGSTWVASPGIYPGANNNVYIQSGFTVTLAENEACNNIDIAVGTTSSSTAQGKVACVTYALSVNGHIRGYYAAVGTTPGTDQSSGGSFDPFTKTGAGGEVKFVGNSRTLAATGQWGIYNLTTSPSSPGGGADWEFALTSGQTATMQTGFRAANVTVTSGTLDMGANICGAFGNGLLGAGNGNFTVSSGATLLSSGTGVILRRSSTGTVGSMGTFTVQGSLKLSGAAPMCAAAAYDFSSGTVEYNGTAQTLLVKDFGTSSTQADPSTYNNLTLSTSGAKKLGITTTVNGTLTMGGTASLNLNSLSLTYSGSSTLAYAGSAQQTTTDTEFPPTGSSASIPPNVAINNSLGVLLNDNKTITGTLTVSPGATLDFNSHTLTTASAPSLNGTLNMEVNKTGANTFTGSKLTQTSGNLTYGGTLMVTATGNTLASGDSVPLFATSGSFGGWFSTVTLPLLASGAAGLSWDTNKLATTGVLDIYSFSSTPLTVSTPINTAAVVVSAKLLNHASTSRGTLYVAAVSTPGHGTASLSAVPGGDLTYTPTTGYSGSDSFNIIFQDGHGTQTNTVSVTVGSGTGSSPNVLSEGMIGGNFVVNFAGIPGDTYTVETNSVASGPGWVKFGNVTAPTSGVFQVSDPAGSGSRFYRTVYPSY